MTTTNILDRDHDLRILETVTDADTLRDRISHYRRLCFNITWESTTMTPIRTAPPAAW